MSEDIVVDEIDELTNKITEAVDEDAEIIFGNGYDSNMNDEVKVTVIAADFNGASAMEHAAEEAPAPAPAPAKTLIKPTYGQVNLGTPAPTAAEQGAREQAEAMQRAGVKAASNPNYYDDIFDIFKSK